MLNTAEEWLKARDGYMVAARGCRETLISVRGYAPGDERVKAAVGAWVQRARNAHAFALGRKPVVRKFVLVDGTGCHEGELFCRPVMQNPQTYTDKGVAL